MQRKLTVILSAEMVGYGEFMDVDEAGTQERLKAMMAAAEARLATAADSERKAGA